MLKIVSFSSNYSYDIKPERGNRGGTSRLCSGCQKIKREIVVLWHHSWGDVNTCLLVPDRELTTDEHGEPMSFVSNLKGYGWGIIHRSRNNSDNFITKSPHKLAWVMAHKSWRPEAHCTSCGLLSRLESIASFPDSSAALCLFQEAYRAESLSQQSLQFI